jgi:hypothetical protein
LVVHFACDNKFSVLAKSVVKKINLKDDTCQVYYAGIGWCEGTIWRICKDEKTALHKMKKYMKTGKETTDDEGVGHTSKGTKRKLLVSIEEEEKAKNDRLAFEDDDDDDEDNEDVNKFPTRRLSSTVVNLQLSSEVRPLPSSSNRTPAAPSSRSSSVILIFFLF